MSTAEATVVPHPKPQQVQGLLYVKVCGASDVPTDTNVNAFVKFSIKSTRSSPVFKTKAVVPSASHGAKKEYTWNEEFVLSVYDKKHPIEFNVMALNQKKPLVGNISFNIRRLVDDEEDECQLATNDAVTPLGASRLHLKFRFTPLSEVLAADLSHEHYNIRLPDFRMVLEKPAYYAGETIIGEVQLNVGGKGIDIKKVGVKVVGITSIATLEMRIKDHVLNKVATLFGHEGENKHIPAGSYSWPFRFVLPNKLPPSYTHHAADYGATSYKCVAFVEYAAAKVPKKVTVPFHLNVCFSAFDEPSRFLKTGTAPSLLKAPRSKLEPETVKMEVDIISPVVHRGTWIKFRVVLSNKAKHSVSHLKVTLRESTIFNSDTDLLTITNNHTIYRKNFDRNLPLLPGKDCTLEIEVPIPAHMNASIIPEFSKLIQVSHFLSVEASCASIARGKVRAVIPLVVESSPPPPATLRTTSLPANTFQVGVTLTPIVPPPQQVMTKAHPYYFGLPRLAESEWSPIH